MPSIKYKKKTYAGATFPVLEMTKAEYDALPEAKKMDGTVYMITASPDNYLDEVFGDFATVEYTDTASKAYAVGDYLVYDSKFYKVTSTIAQGDTIVPDTNVVKTTVGNELHPRIQIPDSSDLNDYTVPGEYYISGAASAATMTNAPPMNAAQTIDVDVLGIDWPHQVARQASGLQMYERIYNPSTSKWSVWTRVTPILQMVETVASEKTTTSLNAHNGSVMYNLFGKYLALNIPSNCIVLANFNVAVNGFIGLMAMFDGNNQMTAGALLNPYFFNASNQNVPSGATVTIRVYSLCLVINTAYPS